MSALCKVGFPLYCCQCLDDGTFLVAGGGGGANTGVKNAVEIFELTRHKKGCVASPIDRLNTEKDAVMSMSATSINKDKWILSISKRNKCSLYEIHKKLSHSNNSYDGKTNDGLKQRKTSSSRVTKKSDTTEDQGVPKYDFNHLNQIDVVPGEGGFQTCVKLSSDGSLVVSGGSDGHLRMWKVDDKKLMFDVQAHPGEVADVDISIDSKQIVSVSRDGHAFLFNGEGQKVLNLSSSWNIRWKQDKFRNCRFGIVSENPSRSWIFTSHSSSKHDPKSRNNGCLTKWSKRRGREGAEVGEFVPAIVQNTGREPISTITVSRNGYFLGVGFMEGSVAIYISFSLQCARRVKSVHSIFVTSLSFLKDTEDMRAITGECDAALISVSADCTSHMTKLGSRALFSLWFVLFLSLAVLVAVAVYLHQAGML